MITNYFLRLMSEGAFQHQEVDVFPDVYYLALSSTTPDESVDGYNITEPNGGGYARVAITNDESIFSDSSQDATVSNHTIVNFPEATQEWTNIGYYALFDAQTGGVLLAYGEFDSVFSVPIQTVLSLSLEGLKLQAVDGDRVVSDAYSLLVDMRNEMLASAESAAESKAAAETSKAAAETAASNAKTSETNAKASEEAAAQSAKDSAVAAVELNVMTTIDGTNTTRVWRAYKEAMAGTPMERYALLSRFCELLGVAWSDKTYGLKWYDENISGETSMTPIADLAGKEAAQLCTETTEPVEDWADEDPMTWYVRGNALSLADGTMNITAFEGEEGFDITGETAPVYTFAMSLYKKVENDGEYNYKYFRTAPADGFKPMAGDIAPDGTFRPLSWRPTFCGGVTSDGKLSSGAGLPPAINWSAVTGNTKAKLWNDYEGLWTDCATIWLLDMWQLRHFNVENSGICEGCTYYYADYTAAVSETGVKRVLLTASQASYLIVNSSVSVGASARASSNVLAQIESITDETVDGTAYKAVNLAVDETFDTTAGTTHISTMPWFGGVTEYLPGHKDGCYYNLTGKGVARIAGVECLNGAYQLQLDLLYNVTDVTTSSAVYELYVQRDSEKLSESTGGYTKVASVTTPIAAGWSYTKRLFANDEVFFPDMFGGSSLTWLKSSFYRSGYTGVRSPWRFGNLNFGGYAGLAFLNGDYSPHTSYWDGSPRLGDSGKKRGELA